MTGIRTSNAPPLSPARIRLRDAAKAARLPLKEISLAIGRNHSYLQQFMARGSPKMLPEAEREAIAHMLGIEPDDLRDNGRPLPPVPSTVARLEPVRQSGRRLPVVTEGREREAPKTINMADMLGGEPAADARVIRLTQAHGMFQPRTMILIDPTAAVRMGDFAVLHEAGAIRAIGLVGPSAENRPTVFIAEGKAVTASAPDAALWRIEAIRPGE